jgi:hypothetical protein
MYTIEIIFAEQMIVAAFIHEYDVENTNATHVK